MRTQTIFILAGLICFLGVGCGSFPKEEAQAALEEVLLMKVASESEFERKLAKLDAAIELIDGLENAPSDGKEILNVARDHLVKAKEKGAMGEDHDYETTVVDMNIAAVIHALEENKDQVQE